MAPVGNVCMAWKTSCGSYYDASRANAVVIGLIALCQHPFYQNAIYTLKDDILSEDVILFESGD